MYFKGVCDAQGASKSFAARHDYGCAVVDLMLPGKDGFALLPELQSYDVPVLFLTARADLPSKMKGLAGGAEDYMVKPFEMMELLLRMDKILKRRSKTEAPVQIRDVVIYPQSRTVTKSGQEIRLKPLEFDCLMILVRNQILENFSEGMGGHACTGRRAAAVFIGADAQDELV